MRKFLIMALAGLVLALVAPFTASAATAIPGEAIKAAADSIGTTEEVRHRRSHYRRHHWRHRGYHHRRHHHHRRYWR